MSALVVPVSGYITLSRLVSLRRWPSMSTTSVSWAAIGTPYARRGARHHAPGPAARSDSLLRDGVSCAEQLGRTRRRRIGDGVVGADELHRLDVAGGDGVARAGHGEGLERPGR